MKWFDELAPGTPSGPGSSGAILLPVAHRSTRGTVVGVVQDEQREPVKTVVIGDVGGQLDALETALCEAGVVVSERRIPEEVRVIQVGDLVHRGPDSRGVVRLVDELMQENPGRWVQLMGNHEAQYCVEEVFEWREKLDDESIATLRRWWHDGVLELATTVPTGAGSVLVTHAGLTAGCWRQLGEPQNAEDAATLINAARGVERSVVWNAGAMLERWVRKDAGVLWAESGTELLMPWVERGEMPFSQVHGHSSAFEWSANRWRNEEVRRALRERAVSRADQQRRILKVNIGEHCVWGIDPGHGREPASRWQPLVL